MLIRKCDKRVDILLLGSFSCSLIKCNTQRAKLTIFTLTLYPTEKMNWPTKERKNSIINCRQFSHVIISKSMYILHPMMRGIFIILRINSWESTRRWVTLEKPLQNHSSGWLGTVLPVNVFTRSAQLFLKSFMKALGVQRRLFRYWSLLPDKIWVRHKIK